MEHYTIYISPALTPAEWLFHVRNIQDEVYHAGYDMRDNNDQDEKSRFGILKVPQIDKFEGVVAHDSKTIDQAEFRQIVEDYIQKSSAMFIIRDMEFRRSYKAVEPIKKDGKNTTHYAIAVRAALDTANWFFHVRSLAEYMAKSGYYLDDFRDGYILDRQVVIAGGSQNVFEGFVRSDLLIEPQIMKRHVKQYLDQYGLTLIEFSM